MWVGLQQVCDVFRPTQEVTGRIKQTTEEPLVANIECNIHPISDSALISTLGSTATELYRGMFPPDVGLRHGDTVVLHTETADLTFRVDGDMQFPGPGIDLPYLVETLLVRTKVR